MQIDDTTPLRFLYLEDDRHDAELIVHQLKAAWGACDVVHVTGRDDFTAELGRREFDVILSDFTLPGFDGMAALAVARKLKPAIPFIFLSGTIGEERAVEALKHGAIDYVLKDRPARLVPSILRALRDAARQRAQEAAEVAMFESEQKFSKAFRAVPDAVLITKVADGRIVDANEGCERLYGYRLEECLGKTTTELGIWHDPADREKLFDALQRGGGVARNMEVRGRTRLGRIVDVVVSCESIEVEGRPHLVTIVHDVTEQKRAERALRESEAKFTQAFRASPWAVGLTDAASGRFVEVNESYCRMFGYAHEEMIGRSAPELGMWADARERDQFLSAFARHGSVPEMEITARRRDGSLISCLLRGERVELEGRTHLISALYDITARRQVEKARAALEEQLLQSQKLDALGQLASGVAHDFNNILTGIVAYTELALMDADQPGAVRGHLAAVQSACTRATDLIRQILTFSRHKRPERRPARLHLVILEAVKLLRATLPKTIAIEEQLDPAAPVVLADGSQIHQVLMNLGTNAAHAMRGKAGMLRVTLDTWVVAAETPVEATKLQPGRYARVTVGDNGRGMSAETLARVFEPFFTTKAPGEGTGLGLPLVRGIVEDHDGHVEIESRLGVGTEVRLLFPENTSTSLVAEVKASDFAHGEGRRILLVDDDPTVGPAAAELLKRFGYAVTLHPDPRLAWAEFDALPAAYDAVVLDITMPHVNGVELAGRMLARRPGLPVIMLTGHGAGWTADRLRTLGIRALISKPVSAEKLLGALGDVVKGAGR